MKELKPMFNIFNPKHSLGYAGWVYDVTGIIPTIKASEYKGQIYILVNYNEK